MSLLWSYLCAHSKMMGGSIVIPSAFVIITPMRFGDCVGNLSIHILGICKLYYHS